MKWRRTDLTLPPMNEPVWLYDDGHTFIGGRDPGDDDGWLWWRTLDRVDRVDGQPWYVNDAENDDLHPSHWMPLPLRPNNQVERQP